MPQIYKVGGCVRNHILNIKANDIDYVYISDNLHQTVSNGFLEMKNWLNLNNFSIFLENEDMLTIRARFLSKENKSITADFVLARREISYDNNSRKPEICLGTLYDDLLRRDLTINALAMDDDNNIIDLFNGVEDIKNKILKTPQDPLISMSDDPLRVLRVLRFTVQLNFKIDDSLMTNMANEQVLNELFNVVIPLKEFLQLNIRRVYSPLVEDLT